MAVYPRALLCQYPLTFVMDRMLFVASHGALILKILKGFLCQICMEIGVWATFLHCLDWTFLFSPALWALGVFLVLHCSVTLSF